MNSRYRRIAIRVAPTRAEWLMRFIVQACYTMTRDEQSLVPATTIVGNEVCRPSASVESREGAGLHPAAIARLIWHKRKEERTMSTVTLEEAQAKLPELIAHLAVGEELIITRDQRPVARLSAEPLPAQKPRSPGTAKGMLTIVAEDDEHLKDFEEYMP